MGGIQQEFSDMRLRKRTEHGKPGIQETMGVMPGGRAERREDRKVVLRVGGSEHIQAIAKVMPLPVGVPADVTVRLAIDAAAFTIVDAFLQAIAGAGLSFPCAGIDWSAIPEEGKAVEVDKPLPDRGIEEAGTEDLRESPCGGEILRRFDPEFCKEIINSYFFDRRGFLPFLRFCRLFLRGMEGIRDVVAAREPQAAKKVIESARSRNVPDCETGKDGIKTVLLEHGRPGSRGGNFEGYREQVGTEHVGREPWFRAKNGIAVLHDEVNGGKIQSPEPFDDFPGGRIK